MIVALLLAAPAQTVAVLEFRDKVPAGERFDAAYLSDQVRAAVKDQLPGARVITRENMLVLLAASGKDPASCEGECEVETGRLIGADLVVSGEVLKFGTEYKLNMKLHDTRSGELLSGAVAGGSSADQLDRGLRPATAKLLAPLLPAEGLARSLPAEWPDTVREVPRFSAQVWVVGGYAWVSSNLVLGRPTSAPGADLGAHLMVRTVGPAYLGLFADDSVAGPAALLIGPGIRLVSGTTAITAGFGYTSLLEGGLGALGAVDFELTGAIALRVQGSWRNSSYTVLADPGGVSIDRSTTVWSLMSGLSLRL